MLIAVLIVAGIIAVIVHVIRRDAAPKRRFNRLPPLFLAFDDADQPPLAVRPPLVGHSPSGYSSSSEPSSRASSSTSSSSFAPPLASTAPSPPKIGIAVPFAHAAGAHVAAPLVPWATQLRVVRDSPALESSMLRGESMPDETVRFRRPADEPVQVLPGRLEVLSGDPRHREIRFVRVPGRPAELILGRNPGDSPQHVTLSSTTVSRQHARFAFLDGRWTVMNLSRTNPIAINGTELASSDASYGLSDGDRLELGEVFLRFHAH